MRNERLIAELLRIQDKLKYSHESKIIELAIRELKKLSDVQEFKTIYRFEKQPLSTDTDDISIFGC